MKKFLLIVQKLLLGVFVISLPLINTDLFAIIHPKLFPARILLIILLGGSFLYGLISFFIAWRKKKLSSLRKAHWERFKNDRILWCLAALWFWRALSLFKSLNIAASLNLLAFYSAVVGLYILFIHLYSTQREFVEKLYILHLVTVSLVGIYGLVQIVTPFLGIKLPGVLIGGTFFRIPATFYDANHLPPYLLTAIPSFLIGSWLIKNKLLRNILFVLSGVLSLVLMFTFSRSGLLGFFIAGLFILFICFRFAYWKKLAFFFSIVAVLFLLVVLSSRTQYSFVKRIASSLSGEEKSTVAHGLLLYGEWRLFLDNPVLGVGYGSFNEQFRASEIGQYHSSVDPAVGMRIPAHSFWMEALAETGLPGFLLLVVFVMLLLEPCYRLIFNADSKVLRLQNAALFAGGLGIMVGAVYYSYNLEFIWFYLFLAYFFGTRGRELFSRCFITSADGESISWKEILPLVGLSVWCGFWFFWRLDSGFIRSSLEGFYSLAGKSVLRQSFLGASYWWFPKINDQFLLATPPLFVWLQAFFMFFYYITTYAARFWSAVFGLLSCVTVGVWLRIENKKWIYGILGAAGLLTLPGFLLISRSATPVSGSILLILLFGLFCYLSSKRSKWWLLVTTLVLVFSFYHDWILALSMLFGLLVVAICQEGGRRFMVLLSGLSGLLLFMPWIFISSQISGVSWWAASRDFFSSYAWSFWPWGTWLLVALLLLLKPLLRFTKKFAPVFRYALPFLLIFLLSAPILYHYGEWRDLDTHRVYQELVLARQRISRVGTHPNVSATSVPAEVLYYSDVPFMLSPDFDAIFTTPREGDIHLFAFIKGSEVSDIYDRIQELRIGSRVVATYQDYVLLETW